MAAILIEKFPESYPYRVYMDTQRISYQELTEMFGNGLPDGRSFASAVEWERIQWVARFTNDKKYRFYIGFNKKSFAVTLFMSKFWD